MDQSQSIQDRFGPAARAYASSAVHRGGEDLDALLAAAALRGSERVLDLGCGAGHTALAFAPRCREVTAYDLTPAMLDQARALAAERSLANLHFRQGDAAELPFADASFEVVTSRLSAHHYTRPREVMAEVARVLAPGGVFLLSDTVAPEDPARDSFLNAFEMLRDPSHVRDHRVSEWHAMFREAGLEPETLGRFRIAQEFQPWVERIGTAEGAVVGLRALFAAAPDEVRGAFGIDGGDASRFELELAVLRGRAL
jgi:ubiquinone/menaquinone biosynthesis C-methylase UbiE